MNFTDTHNGRAAEKRRRQRMAPNPDDVARICWLMEAAIAASFAVPVDEVRAPSRRTAAVAFARQCAMYLTHVVLCLSYSETGAQFRRDRTTAAYACQLVERRRDDPTIDRMLDVLEDLCRDIACSIRNRPQALP